MKRRSHAREVALQVLFQHDHNPNMDHGAVKQFVAGRLKDSELVTFCLSLSDGVINHQAEIDQRIALAAENWRVSRMATVDRNVLRMGTYELFYNPETPARVAFDEAIELARRYGSADSPGFVNGVLDRLYQSLATPA